MGRLFKATSVRHSRSSAHRTPCDFRSCLADYLIQKNRERKRKGAFLSFGCWRGDDNFYPIWTLKKKKKPNFSDESDEIFPGTIFPGTFYPWTFYSGMFIRGPFIWGPFLWEFFFQGTVFPRDHFFGGLFNKSPSVDKPNDDMMMKLLYGRGKKRCHAFATSTLCDMMTLTTSRLFFIQEKM